jgi:RIO-like serine/threonine protein kinase
MTITDKMNYLSKEFKVAVAIYELSIIRGQEVTRVSLHELISIYMNSGELTSSIHFLESWGIVRRRITLQKGVSYSIRDEDLLAIKGLHEMCWQKIPKTL